MHRIRFVLLVLLPALLPGAPSAAQEADPSDVESVDAIVAAVYDVISGPAGEARNWDRWHSLFIPEARLIPVGPGSEGAVGHQVITPTVYAERSGPFLEQNGFFEVEIGRVAERYGHIVHLFSSYESRRTLSDREPFARGINSFQLMFDGTRWWVVSIMWESERPEHPIPERYIGR
jgi:hypothetical protein